MPITRATPVDALYDQVRGYDLVLVPDPPLASSLNRRLDEPHFGPFATTPRRLAAGRRETDEDRIAFLDVIDETDLGWKEAAYAIGNVLQCWDNTGEREAILEYDGFDTPETRAVLDCFSELTTTSKRLAEYVIPDSKAVAVVGIDEFTALERSILPADYDTFDPFTDEAFDHPPFRLFDSPAAIIDALLDSVTPENADRVAVVLDRGSQFSPLVEAALEANDIPFYGGPGFTDDPDHRAFLRLLRVAHAGSDVRIAEARPVLDRIGSEISIDHDEKRLHAVDLPAVTWLTEFCAEVPDLTFDKALSEFESVADTELLALRGELETLGLSGDPVTEDAVSRLEFYLQSYEVPVDRDNEGVLLADATAAATVDRPAVFYLGMDEGWTHASPNRPWVDRDEVYTRNLQQFQRLVQNGVEQYYLVQDESGGRAVTPCLYFEELLDDEFERFSDLDSAEYPRTFQSTGDGFESDPLGVEPETVETISQSSLNRVVNCPRDHLFSRLVDGPDKDYFEIGNLFHDFAEVYAAHPDEIGEAELDAVVQLLLDGTTPFDRDVDQATNRTRFRIGLETIVEYLDANEPIGAGFLTPASGWGRNVVADYLGLEVNAPHTEWWFEEVDLGLKGKVDLVHSPTEFVDYKSGKKYSAAQVVSKSSLDPIHDKPNFQALLYLAYLRTQSPGEPLDFTFFHFLDHLDDVVAGEAELEDCLTTVTYHPVTFEEYITREAVFNELVEDGSGDCQKTFAQVPYDEYVEVIEGHPFPEGQTKAELLDSEVGRALQARASAIVGDYAYVENGCAQALRSLRNIKDATYFADDVDAFEAFVEDRLADLNRYRTGEERFPVEGLGGEPNYRRVDHRDMLFEGDA